MDVRWYATVVVSGLVLPILTVLVAVGAAIRVSFPPQLTLVLLLAGPLIALGATYAMAMYSDLAVPFEDRLPVGSGPEQFRDQVPDRHHDAFAPETLDEPTESAAEGPNNLITAYLVYLVSVPVYTLIVWLLVLA